MARTQRSALKNKIDRLKEKNLALKDKLDALKKDYRSLEKGIRDDGRLLKEIPGAAVLVQDGKIVFINDAPLKRLGYDENDFIGKDFASFIHPESIAYVKDIHDKWVAGKSAPDRYETYFTTKEGDSICCEVRVKKIRYQGRMALLANIISLNDRKKREMQLRRSYKSEALIRMASGLSTEFSDCLTNLNKQVPYLKGLKRLTHAHITELLDNIEGLVERGNRIIQQLQSLAKVKKRRSDAVLVDVRKIVKDTVSATRAQWKDIPEKKGIHINVKTYLRSISPIEGHPEEIQEVFTSMFLNAVDSLPKGGEIYLSTEENAGFAHVYIQDNGEGISRDIRDKLFDPYFTTKDGLRPGLGLSLANAIVSRHGGEIEVMSREGKGTTFVIRLPIAQRSLSLKTRKTKKKIRGSRFLMISDESIIKDLISQLLMNKGGSVSSASTGTEGIKLLKKRPFDMAIVDVNTPYIKLATIIRKIREVDVGIPVTVINTEEEVESPDAIKKKGANLVLSRPMEMDKVLALISDQLSKHASRV